MRFPPVRLPPCRRLLPGVPRPLFARAAIAPLATSASCPAKQMPSRPRPPPEDEFEEVFLKGSGPGGQKILRHKATGIVVKSQATRSRSQNRNIARQLLAARLDELNNGPNSRTAIVAAVKQRRAASATKKSRRKYRRLDEEKAAAAAVAAPAEADGEPQQVDYADGPGAGGRHPDEIDSGQHPPGVAANRDAIEKPK